MNNTDDADRVQDRITEHEGPDGVADPLEGIGAKVTSASVMRSALWSLIVAAINVPVLALSTILVARFLGVSGFGRFAFYSYVIVLLAKLGDLGVGTAILRRGAWAAGTGDHGELVRCVRAGTTWSLAQIPWAALVGALLLPGMTAKIVYVVGVIVSLGFLGPSHYLVMTSNLRWASQLGLVSVALSGVGLVTAATVTHSAAITFAAGMLGTNLLTVFQIYALPKGHRLVSLIPGRLNLSRADFGFGIGTLLKTQLGGFVVSRSEVLFFSGSQARALGVFAGAQTIAARATLLLDALLGAAPIALTTAGGRGRGVVGRSFGQLSAAVVFLMAAVAPLIGVLVASLTSVLLGHGFSGAAAPALVLVVFSLFQTGMQPIFALRFAQRSVVPMLVAGGIAAGADATLAAFLVPAYGAAGAVVANALSGVIYIAGSSASYLRDRAWRGAVGRHGMRVVGVLTITTLVALPVLALSLTVGLLLGLVLAAVVSSALLRSPAIRLSAETIGTLTTALPTGLRGAVVRALSAASGR